MPKRLALTLSAISTFLSLLFLSPAFVSAQEVQSEYYTGRVTAVTQEQEIPGEEGQRFFIQELEINIPELQKTVSVLAGSEFQPLTDTQRLRAGTRVVLIRQAFPDGTEEFIINDVYRLPILGFLTAGFVMLVVLTSRWKGFLATTGMVLSGAILMLFIVPQIIAGGNPLVISLVGAVAIGISTIYLSHGVTLKSHIAVAAITVTLLAVTVLSEISVRSAQLIGLGSEEAAFLMFGDTAQINLQGLLLGGIILGALGVLDDVIVSQVSVVQQLLAVNKKMELEELYSRALEVGKDHVASLVNTLVLAYVGANLPLLLLFYINEAVPTWVILNDQLIAEEVVRTLVGSIGLVLAVPFTSLIAALILRRYRGQLELDTAHSHSH